MGSIPGRVIPKTLKMVPDAPLLGAQHYKRVGLALLSYLRGDGFHQELGVESD